MIDDSHPCYSIKYLRNKPLKELKGDEFLKLVQAEEERLVEMKISIDRDLGPEKRYNHELESVTVVCISEGSFDVLICLQLMSNFIPILQNVWTNLL